jgi:hypothetical protein
VRVVRWGVDGRVAHLARVLKVEQQVVVQSGSRAGLASRSSDRASFPRGSALRGDSLGGGGTQASALLAIRHSAATAEITEIQTTTITIGAMSAPPSAWSRAPSCPPGDHGERRWYLSQLRSGCQDRDSTGRATVSARETGRVDREGPGDAMLSTRAGEMEGRDAATSLPQRP